MSAAELLMDLGRLGIRLETKGKRLRYHPRSALTPDLLERLKAHKVELLTLLPRESKFDAESVPNTRSTPETENRSHRMPPELRGPVGSTLDTCPMATHWPIVEGTEHYQVFVHDDDAPWPEFIPGCHYDFRKPSTLMPLCATRKESHGTDER